MTSETNPNKLASKTTPGPWKATSMGGGYMNIETVDQSHLRTFIGEIGGGLQKFKEIEANAYIISAAPEAIEFIADLIFALSNDGRYIFEPHEWVKKGEIILKKAYNL